MFAIYNIHGRTFRDRLETLRKVKKPNQTENFQLRQDVTKDETEIIPGSHSEELPNNKNIATYREMLHANTRTVIVHAYQIMSHPVITLNSNSSVAQAYEFFQKYSYNQLPVLSPQVKLVGLISRLDVIQANYRQPQITIADLMASDVITADPVSDIRRVASVLYNYKLTALPIVNEQDHLVGIITKTDILKALMNDPPISLWT
jgi:CBS domain-containing protein